MRWKWSCMINFTICPLGLLPSLMALFRQRDASQQKSELKQDAGAGLVRLPSTKPEISKMVFIVNFPTNCKSWFSLIPYFLLCIAAIVERKGVYSGSHIHWNLGRLASGTITKQQNSVNKKMKKEMRIQIAAYQIISVLLTMKKRKFPSSASKTNE